MKKTFSVLLVALLILLFPSITNAQDGLSIAMLWKARAHEASEKLEELNKRLESLGPDEWKSTQGKDLRCKIMLESAFLLHFTFADTVHKHGGKNGSESEWFKIILSAGEGEWFELIYAYEKPSGNLIATKVVSLPKGWELFLVPSGLMVLIPDFGQFAFHATNPFFAMASSVEE